MSKFQAGDIIIVPTLKHKSAANKMFFRVTAVEEKRKMYETTYITDKDQDQRHLVSNATFSHIEKHFAKCPIIFCICFGIFVET